MKISRVQKAVSILLAAGPLFVPVPASATQYLHRVLVKSLSVSGSAATPVASSPASSFSLSSSALDFGTVAVGQSSAQTVAVLNTGNTPLTLPVVSVSGAGMAAAHTCASSLAAGSNCVVSVTFSPVSAGTVSGSLSVGFAEASVASASVSATASRPLLTVDAANAVFGSVTVGQAVTHTYTLANDGNAAATLSYSALPANVTKAGDCPAVLSAGSTCHLTLAYSPVDTSTTSGTLVVSAPTTSVNLSYSGTGVAAVVAAAGCVATGAETVLAQWTFDSSSILATTGSGTLSLTGGAAWAGGGVNQFVAGNPGTGKAVSMDHLNTDGAGLAVSLSTAGYRDINISVDNRVSSTNAAGVHLLADTLSKQLAINTSVFVANTAALPATYTNNAAATFYILGASGASVGGGVASSTGTMRLDNLQVRGTPCAPQ